MLVLAANGPVAATGGGAWYASLRQPPGTPPAWLFGPVWTVLYVTMGVAAWLVWRRVETGTHRKRAALRRWGWQLLVNASWPTAFFGLHSLGLALAVVAVLLAAVLATLRAFAGIDRGAAVLLAPYAAWVGYAVYLQAGLLLLNPG